MDREVPPEGRRVVVPGFDDGDDAVGVDPVDGPETAHAIDEDPGLAPEGLVARAFRFAPEARELLEHGEPVIEPEAEAGGDLLRRHLRFGSHLLGCASALEIEHEPGETEQQHTEEQRAEAGPARAGDAREVLVRAHGRVRAGASIRPRV